MAITLNDNQFFTDLTNLALVINLYATNTSSYPVQFAEMFTTENVGNGDSKIFPYAEMQTVKDYSETSSVTTVTKNAVGEQVLQISAKKMIPTSYPHYILEMAFTSNAGASAFVAYIIGLMMSAKDKHIHELLVTQLFTTVFTGSQLVEVALIDTATITDLIQLNNAEYRNAKNIRRATQLTINNLIMSYQKKYNKKGITQAISPGDLVSVWCDPYYTDNVIDLMATLLKSNVIDENFFKLRTKVIPTDMVPVDDPSIQWIMHRNWLQLFYKFIFQGSFFDGSNLIVNNWLHFWYGNGVIDHLSAVKIAKKK